MAILNIKIGETGLSGVVPRVVYIQTNDTLATVTTAGYLNNAVQQGFSFAEYDMALVTTKTSPSASTTQVAWLELSYVSPNWSLVPTGSPGSVVLPTQTNYLAYFTNTTGQLSSDDGTAITHNGSILAYNDNATSFRLKGPSSPNDPSAGADVQTYSGIFYNDSYSDFGVLKTRATFGANTQMDLVLQAPRGLLLLAYDGTQTDGVIKMASQTNVQIAPRSSGVVAATNYAYFDSLTTSSVDNASAVSLDTHVNHLYFQYGKTTQAIVVPNLANASVGNLANGVLIYDTSANKLMVYANGAWETVTSS